MKVGIGQDSHRFEEAPGKPCMLGGVVFPEAPGLLANSDGDVVLHAVTNAVSGVTCRNILGAPADALCEAGVKDSAEYLRLALTDMKELGLKPVHLSISVEAARPRLSPKIGEMRRNIGSLMGLDEDCIGITATTGEGLTDFGKGLGIAVIAILTVE